MLFAKSTDSLRTNGTRIHTCFSGGRRENRGAGQKTGFAHFFSAFRKPGAKLCVDDINLCSFPETGLKCKRVKCDD
jgi:hypothetical protein